MQLTRILFALLVYSATVSPVAADEAEMQTVASIAFDYAGTMLVVTDDEGAGAIRFSTPSIRTNQADEEIIEVSYFWRYLNKENMSNGGQEQVGRGQLYLKRGQDDEPLSGLFSVRCGPMRLKWSHRSEKWGSVDVDVKEMVVHPGVANRFGFVEGLDRKPRIENSEMKLDKLLTGQRQTLAAPVTYGQSVVIVRSDVGVGMFRFDDSFQKEIDAKETRYGVNYRFEFFPFAGDGKSEGKEEVYEKYVDGQYKNGQLDLNAGPISIEWSRGGPDRGWIYFSVDHSEVWTTHVDDAELLLQRLRKHRM